ncbi:MAG: hypothetical protein WD066_03450 [Planctomycetaceae bacterium]
MLPNSRAAFVVSTLLLTAATAPARAQEAERPQEAHRPSVLDRPLVEATFRDDSLDAVEDGTPGVRPEERPALAKLIAHATRLDRPTRDRAIRRLMSTRREAWNDPEKKFRPLTDLATHPSEYRGRPIRVWGTIRRIARHSATDDLPEHYALSLVPSASEDDSAFAELRLVAPRLPEGLSPGDDLDVPALASAWLLKLSGGGEPAEADGGGLVPTMVADELIPFDTDLAEPILREIRSRRFTILPQERDAYLQSLLQARLVDPSRLEAAADEFLRKRMAERGSNKSLATYERYLDAYRQPEAYRGRPVTFRGHARRIAEMEVEENEYGIDTIYEVWLFTEDSQGNPLVVACTSIPDGIPTGRDLVPAVETVEVTGYLLKMTGYGARDTNRIVPLVVAGRLKWTIPPESPTVGALWWVLGPITGIVLAAIAFLVLRSRAEERAFRARRARETGEGAAPDFDALAERPRPDDAPR